MLAWNSSFSHNCNQYNLEPRPGSTKGRKRVTMKPLNFHRAEDTQVEFSFQIPRESDQGSIIPVLDMTALVVWYVRRVEKIHDVLSNQWVSMCGIVFWLHSTGCSRRSEEWPQFFANAVRRVWTDIALYKTSFDTQCECGQTHLENAACTLFQWMQKKSNGKMYVFACIACILSICATIWICICQYLLASGLGGGVCVDAWARRWARNARRVCMGGLCRDLCRSWDSMFLY